MAIADIVQTINLIAINPNVRQGRPYLIGTSITVADIAIAKNYHHLDADGIADWYGLSLPQVYGALTYYYQHKENIDDLIYLQIKKAEQAKEEKIGTKTALLS